MGLSQHESGQFRPRLTLNNAIFGGGFSSLFWQGIALINMHIFYLDNRRNHIVRDSDLGVAVKHHTPYTDILVYNIAVGL